MTSQRLISDARRRAKQLARVTGRPHQTHLDEIAMQAGRADWAAFVADPVPIAEAVDHVPDEVAAAALTDGPPPRTDRLGDRMLGMWATPAMIAGLVLMATLMISRTRLPLYGPIADNVTLSALVLTCVVMTSLFLICIPAVMLAIAGLFITFQGDRGTRPDRSEIAHMWKCIAMRMVIAVMVPAAFFTIFPAIMDSVPIKDIASHEADARSARWIQVKGQDRPWALSSLGRKTSTGRELSLVALDQRVSPPQLRAVIPDDRFGSGIARAFRDHAVLRLTGTIDCASGRFSVRDIQTADSVSGPAVANAPFTSKGGRTYVIAASSLATVCGRNAADA